MKSADLTLAERIRSGDGGAFEELYRQHAGRLYNLAYRMAGTANDAEDLLQDIFLLAYRKLGSFRGDSSLGTWLYRLAMNHCLDVLRSRQSRMGQQTDSLDDDAAAEPAAAPALGAVSRIDLDRAAAAGVSCGLPAARRRGVWPPGSGRDTGDLGGHVEIAGPQGAPADSHVSDAAEDEAAGGGRLSGAGCRAGRTERAAARVGRSDS